MREIAEDYGQQSLRFQSVALAALQEAAEAHLVHVFENAYVKDCGILVLLMT